MYIKKYYITYRQINLIRVHVGACSGNGYLCKSNALSHTVSHAIPSAIRVPYHIIIPYVLPPPHSDTSIY